MKPVQRVKIFCSYAHEDQVFVHQLKTHFALLQRLKSWIFWTDTEIHAGEVWEQTIQEHLDTAQIILLLISPDFINSDYCYSKEMKRALERHEQKEARVIPILLRPVVSWEQAPFSKLQVLPDGDKPVTDRSWHTPDEALSYVAKKIAQVIEHMHSTSGVANASPSHPTPDTSLEQKPAESALIQAASEQLSLVASQMPAPQAPSFFAEGDFIQIEKAGAKIFAHQDAAYQFLMNILEYYGAQEATLLQYSGTTSLPTLRTLLRKGAKVTLFLQHEDTAKKIGSRFQAERIRNSVKNLRSDLGNLLAEPDQLKVYKYRSLCSMSAMKIDNRVLYMGWYTYEEKESGGHSAYPNDTVELSGHDRAAVVAWKGIHKFQQSDELFSTLEGITNFQRLDNTFSILERNYREHAEVVTI